MSHPPELLDSTMQIPTVTILDVRKKIPLCALELTKQVRKIGLHVFDKIITRRCQLS